MGNQKPEETNGYLCVPGVWEELQALGGSSVLLQELRPVCPAAGSLLGAISLEGTAFFFFKRRRNSSRVAEARFVAETLLMSQWMQCSTRPKKNPHLILFNPLVFPSRETTKMKLPLGFAISCGRFNVFLRIYACVYLKL